MGPIGPKWLQDGPKRPQNGPKRPQMAPRGPQKGPLRGGTLHYITLHFVPPPPHPLPGVASRNTNGHFVDYVNSLSVT